MRALCLEVMALFCSSGRMDRSGACEIVTMSSVCDAHFFELTMDLTEIADTGADVVFLFNQKQNVQMITDKAIVIVHLVGPSGMKLAYVHVLAAIICLYTDDALMICACCPNSTTN
uniref:Uncharacterized protein n=1 Tax=Pristionchus pacificus TaxID=54126 RepID=A0A2A6CK68_PRIPA|eukprot:PDM78614.1 hypothetical protein PRIPAC_31193 [Pristionchus pacificus]